MLDLSSNNLKNLDAQVGIQLTFNNDMQILSDRYTSLNLKNNPLDISKFNDYNIRKHNEKC